MNYPIQLHTMPEMHTKKIKGKIYEGYAAISEESMGRDSFTQEMITHFMRNFRLENWFVKRIYTKYYVVPEGTTILAFELIRLRPPVIERLMK